MGNSEAVNYLVDATTTAANGNNITTGSLLKLILPQVLHLLQGEWSAEARAEMQGQINRALRALGLV